MIVPIKTQTNAPTTTSKSIQGLQPMNTNNEVAQRTLTNAELVNRINDLINLNTLTRNSMGAEEKNPEASYGLKETDAKLAELYEYFVGEDIKAEVRDTPPPVMDYMELMDTGNDAHAKADALLTSIIMNQDGEGFYALKHEYSHAFIASINAEVERMKTTIDGLSKLVKEC